MFAYVLIASGSLFVVAVAFALLIRNNPPIITTSRKGECSLCGREIVGDDWWTLTTVPPPTPEERQMGGGAVTQQDFCPTHRPHLTTHG